MISDRDLMHRILDGVDGLGRELGDLRTTVEKGFAVDAERIRQTEENLSEIRADVAPVLATHTAIREGTAALIRLGAVAGAISAVVALIVWATDFL